MKDVIDELKEMVKEEIPTPVNRNVEILERAIAEIERLRAVAGAVSDGETMADIKLRSQ